MNKLLCSCLCLLDEMIKLYAMREKKFNDFLIGKMKVVLYVIKAYLIHDLVSLYM